MRAVDCSFEDDVLAAVNTGRWPDRAGEDLRAHAATCAICQDVVAVARAFAEADNSATDEPGHQSSLPDASLIWWRAQIRARKDAARLAARPITVAQALAFASLVGVAGAIVGATSSWLQAGTRWLGQIASQFDPRTLAMPDAVAAALAQHGLLVVVAVGACVTIAPIAIYLAMREN